MLMKPIIFWTGIWPNGTTRPIGVYQLAHWLRKHNIESQVIDFCQWYSAKELLELTSLFIDKNTKYIGVSTSFWPGEDTPQNIIDGIALIRKEYPHIKIMFGGPRAENPRIKPYADIVIPGEAETKLLELLSNKHVQFDITQLDHRFVEQDAIIDNEVLPIELGRGCIFKCKFCSHHNLGKAKNTYQRCFHLIEEEITYNYEKFKTTNYNFLDDTVNEDVDKVKNLSMLNTRTGVNINWNGYLRADLLWRYPDTPYQLKESGLRSCFFGIETFHPTASRAIGKGWSSQHGKEYLPKLYNEIWNKEINIWCNFIIGLPGETKEDLEETLQWCLNNPIGMHKFVALTLYGASAASSEFSRNSSSYGYEIIQGEFWRSNDFTRKTARELEHEFNKRLSGVNRLTSWELFEMINCGINVDYGMFLSVKKFRDKNNFKTFLARYKEKLRSLS
jgi:radical SAM superfamily enzyme YgiQ (UPF0313 family)